MPTYNLFGWQKPCYLLQDGYADTFDELMVETAWEQYGTESGNPKCANCMVHCGYEASAVHDGFCSLRGFFAMAQFILFSRYRDKDALALLHEPVQAGSRPQSFRNIQHRWRDPGVSEQALNPDVLEVVPGFAHDQLEGWIPTLATEDEIRERARKGIRLSRRRHHHAQGRQRCRRLSFRPQARPDASRFARPPAPGGRQPARKHSLLRYRGAPFSGRDPAAGKSWEAWVRKYWEKKAAGQTAEIEPEALD